MGKNGKECKTLEIPWWLQLSKRQILTFLPRLSFGTVRSEGSNPLAPTNQLQHKQLRVPALSAVFRQVAILWTKFFSFEELSCISEVTIYEKPPKKREKLRAILTHGPILQHSEPCAPSLVNHLVTQDSVSDRVVGEPLLYTFL